MSVLEVFQQNAERIQAVVLDLIGRFPADLDALGARAALEPTRGDGHAIARRGHPAVRDGPVTDGSTGGRDPVAAADRGLPSARSGPSPAGGSRAPGGWTRRATPGVWAWDHFMGRGDPTVPVVECWTILAMAAGADRAGRRSARSCSTS